MSFLTRPDVRTWGQLEGQIKHCPIRSTLPLDCNMESSESILLELQRVLEHASGALACQKEGQLQEAVHVNTAEASLIRRPAATLRLPPLPSARRATTWLAPICAS